MMRKNKLGLFYRTLFALAIGASLVGLVVYTDACKETAGKAAAMCIELILPSLFPFLVLSNLVIGMGYARALGKACAPLMRRLFNLGGACAGPFLMGIIGGYPIGAKSAVALYESGQCSRAECERMLSFCNNSGPAFILGVVGSGIFSSSKAGILLYAAHVLASVTVGVLFRTYKKEETAGGAGRAPVIYEQPRFSSVFTSSVTRALASVGNISAFVIFFAVATDLLFSSGILSAVVRAIAWLLSPLEVTQSSIERIAVGFLEMTSGLSGLSGAAGNVGTQLSMAAFMLGWAGISVHCQVLSFLDSGGLSLKPYILGKLLHGAVSAVYVRLFLAASGIGIPAAAYAQAELLSRIHSPAVIAYAGLGCIGTAVLFALPHICKFFRKSL